MAARLQNAHLVVNSLVLSTYRARRAASLVGPTRPTAGLESPVLHKFRGFQVGKKLCGKKKKCKD